VSGSSQHRLAGPVVRLVQQGDGNLVVRAVNGTPLWQSHTYTYPNDYLAVQGDGNVVIYCGASPNRALWSTHTQLAAHA
jgi:hypothetical protein